MISITNTHTTYTACKKKRNTKQFPGSRTFVKFLASSVCWVFFFFFFSLLIKSLLDNRSHRCKQQRHRSQRARNRARKHVRLVYMQTYFKCNDFRNVPYVVKWIDRTNCQSEISVWRQRWRWRWWNCRCEQQPPAKQMKCAQRNGKKAKEISRERNKVYLSCSDADDRWLVCISLIIWLQLLENPHTLTLKLHCIQKKKNGYVRIGTVRINRVAR